MYRVFFYYSGTSCPRSHSFISDPISFNDPLFSLQDDARFIPILVMLLLQGPRNADLLTAWFQRNRIWIRELNSFLRKHQRLLNDKFDYRNAGNRLTEATSLPWVFISVAHHLVKRMRGRCAYNIAGTRHFFSKESTQYV